MLRLNEVYRELTILRRTLSSRNLKRTLSTKTENRNFETEDFEGTVKKIN